MTGRHRNAHGVPVSPQIRAVRTGLAAPLSGCGSGYTGASGIRESAQPTNRSLAG